MRTVIAINIIVILMLACKPGSVADDTTGTRTLTGAVTEEMYLPAKTQRLYDRDYVVTPTDSVYLYRIVWSEITDSRMVQLRVTPDSVKYAWRNVYDFEIQSSGGLLVRQPFERSHLGWTFRVVVW